MKGTVEIARTEAEVRAAARSFAAMPRIALDLESNGLFAYRASICIVQLAAGDDVTIVDALAADVASLEPLLAETGPLKVVHDVAFDARLLAERGLLLGNVHDTSIAARMLGRVATGLVALLASELGVTVTKSHQHHDWRVRPLEDEHLGYLASDVRHLEALDDALFAKVRTAGIEDEVLEETRYRLAQAHEASRAEEPPPFARLKGIDRAGEPDLAILKRIAKIRDDEAKRRDVPPHRVLAGEAMLAIARSRPATEAQLRKYRVDANIAPAVVRAIAEALERGERLDDGDRRWLERPRLPGDVARARRERETRLTKWRKAEAEKRGVDEQVILPGHCLKDVVAAEVTSTAQLRDVAGFGAFRVDRYGDAIVDVLRKAPP